MLPKNIDEGRWSVEAKQRHHRVYKLVCFLCGAPMMPQRFDVLYDAKISSKSVDKLPAQECTDKSQMWS